MAFAPRPQVVVVYEGRDITADLKNHLLSVSYIDHVTGKADEIELSLEDVDGLWRDDWYPTKGDTISLKIGYEGQPLTDCGLFYVDEIEMKGPPFVVSIRGIAVPPGKGLRTKNNKAHEGKLLREIAQGVATAHGFTIEDGTGTRIVGPGLINSKVTLKTYGDFMYAAPTSKIGGTATYNIAAPKVRAAIDDFIAKGFADIVSSLDNTWEQRREQIIDETYTGSDGETDISDRVKRGLVKELGRLCIVAHTKSLAIADVASQPVNGVLYGIRIDRTTQNNETDLAFLARICADFGIVFNIKGTKMVFMSIYSLEEAASVAVFEMKDLISFDFKDKVSKTYAGASVRYQDQKSGKVVKADFKVENKVNADGVNYTQITAADTLQIKQRCENQQQAQEMARAKLHQANSKGRTGNVSVPGNPLLCAGNNIDLVGLGKMSGRFHIEQSTHTITPGGGYITEIEHKSVGATPKLLNTTAPESLPENTHSDYVTKTNKDNVTYTQIVQ